MLKERLSEDLKDAMRAKDQVRLRTIRALRAALLEKEIELREGGTATLSSEQETAVLQKQAKQRRDAMEQFEQAGRDDLRQKEAEELTVIDAYLPKQLSDEELRTVIQEVIAATGASSPKDIGRVMGAAMERVRGVAEGRRVQQMAAELLK